MTTVSPAMGSRVGVPGGVVAAGDTGSADEATVGSESLRQVLRRHAKGVTVITAGGDAPVGFCATSLAPVALDPPVLSFSIDTRSRSWATIATAEHVMVHLLADDQEDLAHRFARPRLARFGPATRWHRGAHGLPELDGVLARLLLVPVDRIAVDDHVLVIGRMVGAALGAGGKGPLLHCDGTFGRLAPYLG